ncbi:MAG: biopolymer transporter ExbD [Gammaproteobacteria bacterium]|nr:biopolymer transporter ExbD [Gammaproteobacteria bacterium]
MRFQARPVDEPEINMTSLIDVVLLLVIFFMVSTSFVREAALNIELPQADVEEKISQDPVTLEISVTARGDYLVNGEALVNNRPQTLQRAIRRAVDGQLEVPVVIRADANATHQAVVGAMDAIGREGLSKVRIATINPGN